MKPSGDGARARRFKRVGHLTLCGASYRQRAMSEAEQRSSEVPLWKRSRTTTEHSRLSTRNKPSEDGARACRFKRVDHLTLCGASYRQRAMSEADQRSSEVPLWKRSRTTTEHSRLSKRFKPSKELQRRSESSPIQMRRLSDT